MKKDIEFYSEGEKVLADLYLPEMMDESKKYPGIVLCNGFAGIKEILIPNYAKSFSKMGYISLCIDYRGFGKSEGKRGNFDPVNQQRDIKNAVTYLQSLNNISDEIVLWGSSFGGANAIYVASNDKRIKAVVMQASFSSGKKMILGGLNEEEIQKIEGTLKKISIKEVTKNKKMMLSPDKILTDEESKEFYKKVVNEHPEIDVKIPFTALVKIMETNPVEVIKKVKCPICFISSENDRVCPPEEMKLLYDLANEPKNLEQIKGCKHYEIYTIYFDESFNIAVDFINKHIG